MKIESEKPPTGVRALWGLLKDQDVEIQDYQRYLEAKFLEKTQNQP